jgi:BirA family biotin operon repressor/biotin-[acetyl-CoA-carboxylase] ligase
MPYRPQLKSLVELDAVGSTNDHAKGLARCGAAEGTVVWAQEQTAGRGRQGNSWVSNRGNLFMSMVLQPGKQPVEAGQISFVAAVALAETLKELLPASVLVALKWPNDVLLQGKKSAGILIESEEGFIIVGIGVNVAHAPEGAGSLQSFGVAVDAGLVLEKLAARLMSLYGLWRQQGFGRIRDSWLALAHNIGNTINVRLPRETFEGKFIGIDATGALQVQMQDGTQRAISSGEVFNI